MIRLQVQPLKAAGFAAFGSVVEVDAASADPDQFALRAGPAINDGSALRHEAVPALDLHREGGRAVLAVYQASARTFPFAARGLERHRLSDQVFLPLGGARRCVVLVAPQALNVPRAVDCVAFVTDGRQGVRISAGTWHHGLLALDPGAWAVLERRADALDCDEVALDLPVALVIAGASGDQHGDHLADGSHT